MTTPIAFSRVRRGLAALLACGALCLHAGAIAGTTLPLKLETRDPAVSELLARDTPLERLATGFGFAEGPLWIGDSKGGHLLISDIPANVIYKLSRDGKASVFLERSGYRGVDLWRVGMPFNNLRDAKDEGFEQFNLSGSNGLARDRQGRLLIATWGGRSIDRIERDGRRTVLADRFEGKRLSGTNDLVVRNDGAVYFTDMFGGLLKLDKDPTRELERAGVFMLREGKVTRLVDDIAAPNGLAFSPDHRLMYVDGSNDRKVRRYEVRADGTLGDARVLIDLSAEPAPGITDGMKVDTRGNLWLTGPGGLWIVAPSGKPLGVIALPEAATNLAFGDADRKTLFITSPTSVYTVRTRVAGLP